MDELLEEIAALRINTNALLALHEGSCAACIHGAKCSIWTRYQRVLSSCKFLDDATRDVVSRAQR